MAEVLEVTADGDREALEALALEIERLARRHGLAAAVAIRPSPGRPA